MKLRTARRHTGFLMEGVSIDLIAEVMDGFQLPSGILGASRESARYPPTAVKSGPTSNSRTEDAKNGFQDGICSPFWKGKPAFWTMAVIKCQADAIKQDLLRLVFIKDATNLTRPWSFTHEDPCMLSMTTIQLSNRLQCTQAGPWVAISADLHWSYCRWPAWDQCCASMHGDAMWCSQSHRMHSHVKCR